MNEQEHYRSPLETRYASDEMQRLWSSQKRIGIWRRLWLALAEAEAELGLDISDAQLDALRDHLDDIDFEAARGYEHRFRHDVMAHVHAFGDVAPSARGVIHLGATSQFVGCNADLIVMRDALEIVARKTAATIDALATFAESHRSVPTLAFTHYQPAQPTTVGKRATLWAYDLVLVLEDIEHRLDALRLRSVKGTTGTQASFLALFDGDHAKVDTLDRRVAEKMGWPADRRYVVTGQTYPRVVDAQIVGSLAAVAATLHKCATDIRLLANRKEIEEPIERDQIGSSAMAYKRNPMRCERVCGMTRFVMSLAANPLQTCATQWLERTLDDSSNRRLALAESFLALDGALDVMHNVACGLVVYEHTIRANLLAELPFMATENLLMAATQAGADRQEAHEVIRRCSVEAAAVVKSEGKPNDLMERLRSDPIFASLDLDAAVDPTSFVGRAPEQVDAFLEGIVGPIRARYDAGAVQAAELRV